MDHLGNTLVWNIFQAAPQDQFYRDPQAPYNPQQYNQTIPQHGMQFNKPYEAPQQYQPQQMHQHQQQPPIEQARVAEPEKPKAPIPEEHVHLKTVFDELRHQCYETAKNPVRILFLLRNTKFIQTRQASVLKNISPAANNISNFFPSSANFIFFAITGKIIF